jgi:chorismate mutase
MTTEPATGPRPESDFDPHATSLEGTADPAVLQELFEIRGSIDNFDATLVYLLAERFKCTQRVGRLKAEHRLPPSDPGREAAQINRLRRLAEDADLDPAFAEKFLNFIVSEVIQHHQAIAGRQD